MIVFPSCKINLGLNIVAKRNDGFHNIETCFFPITSLSDVLEIVPNKHFAFFQTGIPIQGNEDNNLVVKAFKLFQQHTHCGNVNISLHKCIPTGAGLGGGSADATFTLLLLNDLFKTHLSVAQLVVMASQLGSDCAFFIQNQPSIGKGLGNELNPITIPQLQNCYIMLVKPNLFISTADAYNNCRPQQPTISIAEILALPIEQWKNLLINDFEKTLFPLYPQLEEVKNIFYHHGAVYASLSGSGATVFGIFRQTPPNINWEKDYFVASSQISVL